MEIGVAVTYFLQITKNKILCSVMSSHFKEKAFLEIISDFINIGQNINISSINTTVTFSDLWGHNLYFEETPPILSN